MNPMDQAYLNAFNKTFVSLCWVDCEIGTNGKAIENPRIFCTSGFVIEYLGEWLWITAGHLLYDLDNKLPAEGRRIVQSHLIAGWNPDSEEVSRIAFDYGNCLKFYTDDDEEGTDFGMIYIFEELRKKLIESGVVPIRKLDLPEQQYEMYLLHGLPKKEQRDDIEVSNEGIDCVVSIMPVTFRVFPLESGTGGFRAAKRHRFYASVPAEVSLETLDGLSGGPIYAIKQESDRVDCFLAAIQNMERQISKTIAACPVALFTEILARGFAEIQQKLGK